MLRVSNMRRSGAGFALNGGLMCESVNGTITSPCASAGRIHSKFETAPRVAAAKLVLMTSRRFMLISVLLGLQCLDVPLHSINRIAVGLDPSHLELNGARPVDIKRRR